MVNNENDQKINNSKIEKIDLNLIEQEKQKEEFFDYTSKLLKDEYFLKQCKKYIKLKEEEKDSEQ